MIYRLFPPICTPLLVLFPVVLVLWGAAGSAQECEGEFHLTLGTAVGNPGDTVEVPLTIESGELAETLVLFIDYDTELVEPDSSYFEFVETNLEGEVVRTTSAVRPEFAVTSTGKVLQAEVRSEGFLAIGVTGINADTLPQGLLCTIGFRIQPGATGPILIDGDDIGSSASATGPNPNIPLCFEVVFLDGEVATGCLPPAAPGNVSATQGRSDGVRIAWDAIAVAGAEYRVYRNTQLNIATAVPLGEGWQAGTSITDVTALPPDVEVPKGCPRREEITEVRYYYWVRAREPEGCISEFSAEPAVGFRGESKAVSAAGVGGGLKSESGTALVYLGMALALAAGHLRKTRGNVPA
jgi:hypothetical protein